MAVDYDEVRPDVAEASKKTLQDVQSLDAPTAKTVHEEMDEVDFSDGAELPGAILSEDLTVEVVPQRDDEFVCIECFTVRHKNLEELRTADGITCRDCVNEYL